MQQPMQRPSPGHGTRVRTSGHNAPSRPRERVDDDDEEEEEEEEEEDILSLRLNEPGRHTPQITATREADLSHLRRGHGVARRRGDSSTWLWRRDGASLGAVARGQQAAAAAAAAALRRGGGSRVAAAAAATPPHHRQI
eukprot:SAG25_NODE_199_length_12089_cov_86.323853_2_plen_139_part_00